MIIGPVSNNPNRNFMRREINIGLFGGVPGIPRQGGQATWTSKGDVYSGGSMICKNRGGRKNPFASARASYGWGPGARPYGPCRGLRGQSPRKLSSFQQIRAFKMVVRSNRNCNFSRCNFAYRARVGGAGVTRFSVVVDSMALFFFTIRTWKHM